MKKIVSLDESVIFCMLASALAAVPKWSMWLQITSAILSIIILVKKKGLLYKCISIAVLLDALYEIASYLILRFSFGEQTFFPGIVNPNLVYGIGVFAVILIPILFLAWSAFKGSRNIVSALFLTSPVIIALSKNGAFLVFISLLCTAFVYDTEDRVLKKMSFVLVPLSLLSSINLILTENDFSYEYMYSIFGRIGIFLTLSCYAIIIALFAVLLRKANNSLKNICIPAIIGGVCLLSSMINDGTYRDVVSIVHFFGYMSFAYAFYSFHNILSSKSWEK